MSMVTEALENVQGAEMLLTITFAESAGYLQPADRSGVSDVPPTTYRGLPAYTYVDLLISLESRKCGPPD
jgi:hypothetical protein